MERGNHLSVAIPATVGQALGIFHESFRSVFARGKNTVFLLKICGYKTRKYDMLQYFYAVSQTPVVQRPTTMFNQPQACVSMCQHYVILASYEWIKVTESRYYLLFSSTLRCWSRCEALRTMADDIVKLNVGGVYYKTCQATLVKDQKSKLAAMFSGRSKPKVDEDGSHFIDRDGELFRYGIYALMKCNKICCHSFTFCGRDTFRDLPECFV